MSRAIRRTNFRVEVTPRSPGDFGSFRIGGMFQKAENEWLADCEEIASQIRRHVDGLPSDRGRGVDVMWDEEETCSHCGARWTEGDSPHNGGCCAADYDVMEATS